MNMSEYCDLLSKEAKGRYEEKLKLTELGLVEDPYNKRNKNQNDMTAWSPLKYGHVLMYFIRQLGLYM